MEKRRKIKGKRTKRKEKKSGIAHLAKAAASAGNEHSVLRGTERGDTIAKRVSMRHGKDAKVRDQGGVAKGTEEGVGDQNMRSVGETTEEKQRKVRDQEGMAKGTEEG